MLRAELRDSAETLSVKLEGVAAERGVDRHGSNCHPIPGAAADRVCFLLVLLDLDSGLAHRYSPSI